MADGTEWLAVANQHIVQPHRIKKNKKTKKKKKEQKNKNAYNSAWASGIRVYRFLETVDHLQIMLQRYDQISQTPP